MKKYISAALVLMLLSGAGAASEKPVQAAVRGNTAVVAVPYEWMHERCSREYPEYPPGKRTPYFQSRLEVVDENWLAENLPEGTVEGMEKAVGLTDGGAYYLDIDMLISSSAEHAETDRLPMSVRFIDNAWYLVFRQKEMNVDNSCRYSVRQVYWGEKIEVVHHWGDLIPEEEIDVSRFKGSAAYETQSDNLSISVFEAIGANIAVIEEKNADKNLISQVKLMLPGGATAEISGYMDGKNAVYCCVLSDQEMQLLKDGASIQLLRNHLTADYADTPWGIVQSGKYWGIVDRDGKFIVDAKYTEIERTDAPGVFVLHAPNLSMLVYDANRRRGILTIQHDGGWGTGIKVEPDGTIIICFPAAGVIRVYKLEDGSLIRQFDEDTDGKTYQEWYDRFYEDSGW